MVAEPVTSSARDHRFEFPLVFAKRPPIRPATFLFIPALRLTIGVSSSANYSQ
jgi:hypothetical protein